MEDSWRGWRRSRVGLRGSFGMVEWVIRRVVGIKKESFLVRILKKIKKNIYLEIIKQD